MKEDSENHKNNIHSLRILTKVNVLIWVIANVALIFLMQNAPAAKGMFPILAGGSAVGISMIATMSKLR